MEGNALDENTINSLVDIFAKTIDVLQEGEAKEKLQKSKNILERLKQIEEEQNRRDEADLAGLDDMIKDL